MNHTASSGDIIAVPMTASLNAYLRTMAALLVTQEDGAFVLRHEPAVWHRFFALFGDGQLDADVAFEQLQAVIDEWNITMSQHAAATPIPV